MKELKEAELEDYLKKIVDKNGAAASVFVEDDGAVSFISVMKTDKRGIARLAQGLIRAGEEIYTRHEFPIQVRVERKG